MHLASVRQSHTLACATGTVDLDQLALQAQPTVSLQACWCKHMPACNQVWMAYYDARLNLCVCCHQTEADTQVSEYIVEDDDWRAEAAGGAGEEVCLQLLLRVVADVGIVGFPNAGKSSLLAAITRSVAPGQSFIAPFATCCSKSFCCVSNCSSKRGLA